VSIHSFRLPRIQSDAYFGGQRRRSALPWTADRAIAALLGLEREVADGKEGWRRHLSRCVLLCPARRGRRLRPEGDDEGAAAAAPAGRRG